jgi:hypothetical protein
MAEIPAAIAIMFWLIFPEPIQTDAKNLYVKSSDHKLAKKDGISV